VTLGGAAGGLSHDGATLVVANVEPSNARSTFVVLSTQPLTPQLLVDLRGSFAFDALSPDGRTLYLIEHTTPDLSHYRVRAYDLALHRLLPNAIADKRQAGWNMSGYPVARATSADARWVYTLYRNDGGYPFVHALDSVRRTACASACRGRKEKARMH
jgi:hypothetical protein